MRIFTLLMVLLCGLGLVCGARAAEPQSSSSQPSANSFNSDLISPSAVGRQDFVQVWPSDRANRYYSRSESERDGSKICYTIQNFLVKREPHSDVTVPSGYSTCLPSSKYSVKAVDEPDQAPSQ
ncbi:MAG: hypothetical protein WB711_15015 [Terriglobales bacterium]